MPPSPCATAFPHRPLKLQGHPSPQTRDFSKNRGAPTRSYADATDAKGSPWGYLRGAGTQELLLPRPFARQNRFPAASAFSLRFAAGLENRSSCKRLSLFHEPPTNPSPPSPTAASPRRHLLAEDVAAVPPFGTSARGPLPRRDKPPPQAPPPQCSGLPMGVHQRLLQSLDARLGKRKGGPSGVSSPARRGAEKGGGGQRGRSRSVGDGSSSDAPPLAPSARSARRRHALGFNRG
jgi:hypothetical protein